MGAVGNYDALGLCLTCCRTRFLAEVKSEAPLKGTCTECFREREYEALPKLYFAFGMNLDPDNMWNAEPAGAARLHGWKLTFRYYADIEREEGASLPGGLWHLTLQMLRGLDGREGYPNFYDRTVVEVETPEGDLIEALVYTMRDQTAAPTPPSPGYLNTIRQGYEYFGLPLADLDAAAKAAGKEA